MGGGALGALHVLNSSGQIAATLKVGTELDKFDPRGIFFTDDGRVLISDASDPILVAGPDDFAVVPEPSTFLIWSLGLLGLIGWRRRRR